MENTIPQKRMDELVAYVFQNKTDDVRNLLTINGVTDAASMPTADVQRAFLKAVKDNSGFRSQASNYFSTLVSGQNFVKQPFVNQPNQPFVSQPYVNAVNDAYTVDQVIEATAPTGGTTTTPVKTTSGSFWSNLGGLASKENLNKLFNTGLDTLSNKLQNDANRSSEERALELERLRLQQLQTQQTLGAAQKPGLPGWGIALIVVGSLAVVGTVIYLVVRKK